MQIINRTLSPLSYGSEAEGSTTAAQDVLLSNSGNQGSSIQVTGLNILYAVDDFPTETATSPACSFPKTLQPSFTCNVGVRVRSGVDRHAQRVGAYGFDRGG